MQKLFTKFLHKMLEKKGEGGGVIEGKVSFNLSNDCSPPPISVSRF